jgi:hypothetical protein
MKTDLKNLKLDTTSSEYNFEEQKRVDNSYTGKQINLLQKIEDIKKKQKK